MRGRGRRILVIGSGPIVIGQACEFDYSGTQACRALRQDGAFVVLVNSNPATIMTDPSVADRTYIEPLTVESVTAILERERPDSLLPTVGGQTALNLALELHRAGVLDRLGVKLIGASPEAIELAEDRERFAQTMARIGLATPISCIVRGEADFDRARQTVGVPCIVRPSFTLGGSGGGLVDTLDDLDVALRKGLAESPTRQVLVEASIAGWKEYELEVVRDRADNAIIVCSIENLDPMGVHTGDSVTVAPAQTLTDREYQAMRNAALQIVRAVGVETGGCNIQFAVNPADGRLVVIEMNPRVSRSSALASKATGFPIAKVAARLALGDTLDQIANDITRTTPASFEPAIDYVVVKIPRFDFAKFEGASRTLGPQMKSVGEVMAIGRTFREALGKGLAALETPLPPRDREWTDADLQTPTPNRLFAVLAAVRAGRSLADVYALSRIDPWFLHQFALLAEVEREVQAWPAGAPLERAVLRRWKREGLTDAVLADLTHRSEGALRADRLRLGVLPTFHQVDTCAGEFEAHTPYLYSSWESASEAPPTDRPKVVILGSGPNRIGQGIEFDYCCVHAAYALKDLDIESVMINCNPETVSTDYDTSDRLYFEPLTLEHVLAIVAREQPLGVIVQLGGQTPLQLAHGLQQAGVAILGTSPDAIDLAEDRGRFGDLLRKMGIRQPEGGVAHSLDDALVVAERIGWPVLVRPSYVLGGQSMRIAYDEAALRTWLASAARATSDRPVLVDRYLEDAFEYDVDALCDGTHTVIAGILEHVEEAGVHSGDSTALLPPYKIKPAVLAEMKAVTRALGPALGVHGLMNIQFAEKAGQLYVLEVNPRASRTVPFLAKATGLPLVQYATRLMLGESLLGIGLRDDPGVGRWYAKAPVFPFRKFPGVDVLLGPEMRSTGEVMGVGATPGEAFWKALTAAGVRLPESGTVFVSVNDGDKPDALAVARRLHALGFALVATRGTALWLFDHGVPCQLVYKIDEGRPNVADLIGTGTVHLVINTPLGRASFFDEKAIRVAASAHGVAVITTLSAAEAAVQAMEGRRAGGFGQWAVQDAVTLPAGG
ncbi:MAG: carbamoyl-phosphate synthase large subunit [Myxococcales bacterium]|nr:carbamoyl-phosphate synthase large subunit [Myxococcales bacterium]